MPTDRRRVTDMTLLRDPVRWGIIGVGDVVEHKSGPAFSQVPGSELVAVMRRTPGRAHDFAVRHGVRSWYDDGDALIADPDVDAVYVATPPDAHARWTIAAATAGKPVYVEKPMARTAAECQAMLTACEEHGTELFVAYYRRALPRFEAARDAIRSGRLGDVHAVVVSHRQPPAPSGRLGWRVVPEVSGGGLFVDLASHTLDWIDHAIGPIDDVVGTADGDGGPAETVVTAHFTAGDGVRGLGLWDFASGAAEEFVEVIGDRATLRMSVFDTAAPVTIRDRDRTEALEFATPAVIQQPMVTSVVRSLLTGSPAVSTGRSALRTARVIDTLLAGHRTRHEIVPDHSDY